jgi:hypothetical protein
MSFIADSYFWRELSVKKEARHSSASLIVLPDRDNA